MPLAVSQTEALFPETIRPCCVTDTEMSGCGTGSDYAANLIFSLGKLGRRLTSKE